MGDRQAPRLGGAGPGLDRKWAVYGPEGLWEADAVSDPASGVYQETAVAARWL